MSEAVPLGDERPSMGHCDNCGRDNKATARFCAGCGSSMARSCAACGHELEADARFCEDCGSPVAAAPPSPAPDPIAPSEAVRKTVTVLFCDLVGSTAFAERVDAESARESMGRYHAMAKSAIEANGGTVAKFIGDGVMALFGVPEVAEDDAERAVAAGADLQRGFEPVRDHIGSRYGVEVGLRVGINTGEVVIDDADADLVGDVLNTAARLEAACTPGQVLVGEETWRLTRSAITYEALGEVSVKGKRDGLATYQVVLAEGDAPDAAQPDSTPFIGRDDELGRLRSLFEEAVTTREARLVTVIGSPGVGKTRLARELGAATAADADVVEIRCERAGTATFAPIVDLLQQVAGLDDGDTPEQIVAALCDLVGGEHDADRVVELLGGFVGTAKPRSTEDAFFGVRRLVEVLGGHRPLVLVIDDIQWAEPLFLDLLEHLAEWSKTAPVMIVGLARPELRDIRPALAETGRRVALVVSLEGLNAAATELLAAELLGGAALPKELAAKLPSSTDGNPLFVRELIRMLVDDGVIAQRNDRWELAVDLDAVEVPPTIQSLLATRVERLPAVERRVLEQASVIGPEFPLGALAELMPDVGRNELEQVIERLRRKEQLDQTGTYWGDEPIVRFHHVLIRDAAYRRLLKGARAELHLRVGEWMDRTAAGLVGEFEVSIAYHFEQAQAYRHQLGDDDTATAETGRRAAALLHIAAARALERDDLSAASGLGRRAISCLADDDPTLPELLVLACEAVLASGDATTGADLVKRLSERALGDARLEAWATCFSAQLAVMTDPDGVQRATEATQDAATQFEALGDQAGLAKARIERARALARLGQVGAAETQLDLALTAARAGNDRRRITSVLGAAPVAALWGPSPVARAGGRCLDVVRLSRIAADSPAVVATSSRCQAVLEAMRGRFDTARSLLSASRTTNLELGLDHGLLETSLFAGIVELLADNPVAAEPHLREAFGGLGQLGIGADAGQAAAHLARSLMRQGRLDEADELAADSDALAGQNLQTAIAARSVQAEILAARGDTDPALALADEAVRLAAGTDFVFDHANAMAALARVRAAAGDADGAQRAASGARDLYGQKGATVVVDVATGAPATSTPTATTSDGSAESSAIEPSDEPWNEADRLFRQNTQLFTSGNLEAWEAMLGDDVRGADLRSGVRMTIENKANVVEQMLADGETMGPMSCDVTTIAARGDDLVLAEMNWTRQDDPTGPRLDALHLGRWSGGKQVFKLVYEIDDLRAAVADLDRMYLATLDPIEGAPIARFSRSFESLMNRDVDQTVAPSDPNVAMEDHRQLGWERLSGVAELRERFLTLSELDGSVVTFLRNSLRQSPNLLCCRLRNVYDDPSGGRLIDDSIALNRFDPATGLAIRIDQFAEDQLAEALAYFDAVQAEIDATIPAPNTAVLAGGVANERARTASLDEFLAMFADDFTASLTDGSTVTIDDLRTGTVEPTALGYGVTDRRIMSVLTDRLAMLYVGTDEDTGHWSVEEVDDTGRLRSVRQFEGVVDASDAIEARSSELDPTEPSRIPANRAVIAGGLANYRARLPQLDRFLDSLADDLTATLPDGTAVTLSDLRAGTTTPAAIGFGITERELVAVRGERLALLRIEGTRWSIEQIDEHDRLTRITLFDNEDLLAATNAFERIARGLPDAEAIPPVLWEWLRAHANYDLDGLEPLTHDDVSMVDHRQLGYAPMDGKADAWALIRIGLDDEALRGVPVYGVTLETNERAAVIRGGMWLPARSDDYWESNPFIGVYGCADGELRTVDLFPEDDLDAALTRFEELDSEALADTSWNLADRVARDFAREIATGRVGETRLIAEHVIVSDRRPMLSNTYTGREAMVDGFRTTGTDRPWQVEFDTLATRGTNFALMAQRWSKVDDPGTSIEHLSVVRVDSDGLIDLAVMFDPDDLAAAVDELDRLHMETVDPIEAGVWELVHIHYDAINDGDPVAALVVYDSSAVFVDHRLLGWGSIDVDGMRERFSTITNMTHDHLTYLRRMHALTPGVACATGRNHYVTPEGIEIDDDILSVFATNPATGLTLGTEQFDPDDLDAALARYDELAAAAHARPIATTRAVSIGGYANVSARLPEPDRFIDGLSDDFTATLPDGTVVTVADLRARTVAPTAIGFGITERELIAVRGERLALLRIEGARWSIEQIDDHDRLVRVTLFDNDDLLAARNVFEETARAIPDHGAVPDKIWTWLDAHANYDLEAIEHTLHDDVVQIDHRPLGYEPMGKSDLIALYRTGLDDDTLRAVPVYGTIVASSERAAVLRGGLWLRAHSGDYWLGNPYMLVIGTSDRGMASADIYPEDDLAAAMARFEEL